jgi:hypothetical protein
MSEVKTEEAAQVTTPSASEVKVETTVEAVKPAATEVKAEATNVTPEVKTPEKVVPEKYELKLGEGSLLDNSALERIGALARSQGLSNEEAQGLVDRHQEETFKFIEERKAAWHKEASNDKEIGGEQFAHNAELAKRAFERVAPPGLKEEMDKTGYGNHPLILKMFVNLGRMMADDKLVQGGAQGHSSKSAAELLYGSTKP